MYERAIDGDAAVERLRELCAREDKRLGCAAYMRESFEKLGLATEGVPILYEGMEDANVFADYRGEPSSDRYVLVCAHRDAVDGSPGANDNGSGSVMLLGLAEALQRAIAGINVRFASYGLEEEGLIGSQAHAQSLSGEERSRIKAAVNLDGVGAGEDLVVVAKDYCATSTPWVNAAVEAAAVEMGIACTELDIGVDENDTSDPAPLIKAGVPATFICRMDDLEVPNIHTPDDRVENIDPAQLAEVGDLTYGALFRLYGYRSREG